MATSTTITASARNAALLLRHPTIRRSWRRLRSTATVETAEPAAASTAVSQCPFHRLWNTASSTITPKSIRPTNQSDSIRTALPYEALPTPKALPLIGTTLDVIRAGGAAKIHEYCDRRHAQLGPLYREKLGAVEAVFVADPKLIQQVYTNEGQYPMHMVPEAWTIYNQVKGIKRGLFFMDGPEWIERRRALNAVFLRPKTVTDQVPVFNEVIGELLSRWRDNRDSETQILGNLESELYNWSIESLGAMIFGRRLGCISQNPSGSVKNIHHFAHSVQQIFRQSAKMSIVSAKLAHRLNLPVWKRFMEAAEQALDLARQYVEENVANGEACSGSLLQQLMSTSSISQDELVRIVTDLFLAAADTTSHATQWALYLLARNPQCQETLYREVQQVVPKGQNITEEALPRLPYVKAVIKEALRLYPVAPFLTRILRDDIVLNGYTIPKNKLILMSLYTTGRDPNHFEDPNSFRPERWVRNSDRNVNAWACLPFGLGSRSCIGRRVAEVQMQFLIARTIQQFRVSTDKEIPIRMRLITTPDSPIALKMEDRS